VSVRLPSNIQGAKHTPWNKLRAHNGGECTRNIIHYFCNQWYLWCVLFHRRSALRQEITGRQRERFIYRSSLGPDKTRRYLDECNSIIQWPEFRPMPFGCSNTARLLPFNTPRSGVKISDNTQTHSRSQANARVDRDWRPTSLADEMKKLCRTHLLNCALLSGGWKSRD
jgi:hypothetical protein